MLCQLFYVYVTSVAHFVSCRTVDPGHRSSRQRSMDNLICTFMFLCLAILCWVVLSIDTDCISRCRSLASMFCLLQIPSIMTNTVSFGCLCRTKTSCVSNGMELMNIFRFNAFVSDICFLLPFLSLFFSDFTTVLCLQKKKKRIAMLRLT